MTTGEDCVEAMARKWYGYGRWEAPYWFIGPEPGMGTSENNKLLPRCEAWMRLGGGELVDCKAHSLGFQYEGHHQDHPRLQSTWRPLILLLSAFLGRPTDNESLREYQRTRWGMEDGETCVIELCSLAAESFGVKREIEWDADRFRNERIQVIRQRIERYKPALVVMYGKRDKQRWEAIVEQQQLRADSPVRVGSTIAVMTPHPVSVGRRNSDWLTLAEKLRNSPAATAANAFHG